MKEDEKNSLYRARNERRNNEKRGDKFKIVRGKYIIAVDGDNALIQKDILNNSFHIAQMADLDIYLPFLLNL